MIYAYMHPYIYGMYTCHTYMYTYIHMSYNRSTKRASLSRTWATPPGCRGRIPSLGI